MTPFKSHVVFGLVLLLAGLLFDFGFVARKASEVFQADPVPYLHSWERVLYDLTKSYMMILGLASIAFGFVVSRFPSSPKIDWTVFFSLAIGSVLLVATGFWYASAGPAATWQPRCTVMTIGLLGIVLSLGLETYRVLTGKPV